MIILSAKRTLIPLVLGLMTASLAWGGDAISKDANGPTLLNHSAVPASALAQRNGAPSRPADVLYLRGPGGEPAQLVRVSGVGWTYTGKVTSSDDGDAALRSASSISTPMQGPLSVFIDGPTGYTFVFIQDAGWKFVGVLDSAADGSRTEGRHELSKTKD